MSEPTPSPLVFFGESFRVNPPEDCQWAMLEFAEVAGDESANELAGAGAVMGLLKAAIHEDDWTRFRSVARKQKAQIERDLMPVVVEVFQQETGRPTLRPSDSSDGPPTTTENSAADYSLQVVRDLEARGRPDMALAVLQAQESRVSA